MSFLTTLKTFSKARKKQLSIIPYLFTFASVFFGFLAVIKAFEGNFVFAAYCISIAAFMDMLDGKLARAFNSSSLLGMELDSLCDAVSFCFVPVIVMYGSYLNQIGLIGFLVLVFYLCCGLFRLAKFNVSMDTQPISYFSGLSTTISGFLLANIIINAQWILQTPLKIMIKQPHCLALLIAAISLLMISPLRFPSFKKTKRWVSYFLLVSTLMSYILCLIYAIPFFLAVTVCYIVTSITGNILYHLYSLIRSMSPNTLD